MLPLALELGTDAQELAGAALLACLVQGLIHWKLRRRAAAVRRHLIAEVRALLQDRINNHLQVVLFSLAADGNRSGTRDDRERLTLALAAVGAVSRTLDELSTDTLRRWKDHYGSVVSGAASSAGSAVGSGTGGSAAGR
jgi:plasmid stability protein